MLSKGYKQLHFYALSSFLFSFLIYFLSRNKDLIQVSLFAFFVISIIHYRIFYLKTVNLKYALFLALFIRITFIIQEPLFSDDIYRYFWDSFLISNGENPLQFPPNHFSFADYAKKYQHFSSINNPDLASSYNLIVQLYMFTVYQVSDSIYFLKFSYLAVEILAISLILKKNLFDKSFLVFLLLHPLMWIESYQSGHFDILYLYFSLLMIGFYKKGKYKVASIFNILSGQIRYLTSIILLFSKKLRPSSVLSVILFSSAFLWMSKYPDNGLYAYSQNWSFNNPLYEIYHAIFLIFYNAINNTISYGLFIKLLLFISIFSLFVKKLIAKKDQFIEFFTLFYTMILFSSAVIYPWYCLLLIPLSYLSKNKSLTVFTYSIFFSYYVLIQFFQENLWKETVEQFILVYLAPILMYLYEKLEFKKKRLKG